MTPPDAQRRYEESLKFNSCCLAILGMTLGRAATKEEDTKGHFDLVFRIGDSAIGARVQKAHYYDTHGPHATFRNTSYSGMETEWLAIKEGRGPTYFLAAHEHPEPLKAERGRIGHWHLLDLRAVADAPDRKHGPFPNRGPDGEKDGSSLYRIQLSEYPATIVLAKGFFLRIDANRGGVAA